MASDRHARLEETVRRVVSDVVAEAGLELVELALRGSSQRRTLRVDIDRVGPELVTVDDCTRISNALDPALEQADVLPGSYLLEVSSPGIDRPIRTADDIRRNTGRTVHVVTTEPIAGRTEFRGVLLGRDSDTIRIAEARDAEISIPWTRVERMQQDVGM